jgi:enterochelin esterase-like enzyme
VREFLPWAHERLNVTRDPAQTIIGGASAGGLSAAYAALEYPKVFGCVISQSGAFWRSTKYDPEDEWLSRQFLSKPRGPTRFYLTCGSLENTDAFDPSISNVEANRHFRDILLAKGYGVRYQEVMGGHDPYNWELTLPDALIMFLGTTAAANR